MNHLQRPRTTGQNAIVLRIQVLGPVGATDDTIGSELIRLALGGPRPRATLAILALAAPRTCTTDQIVDGLWGEDPPPSARNAVQVNVTMLRKVLRPHDVDIARVGDGYALTGSARIDIGEFDELVSAGRTALRAGDAKRSAEALTTGLELWQGTPFDGLDGAPFSGTALPVLNATRAAALADLAEAHLRIGDPAAAVATGQAMVADYPLDERGWAALATAHYCSGQQDLALDTCRRGRDLLVEELGVDPTNTLTDVEQQILDHAVPDRSPRRTAQARPELPAASMPAAPLPLVGRDDLVAEVLDRYAGGARLVTLVGMGGIGKTSVALAVAHRLAEDRRVWFCPCETDQDGPAVWSRVLATLGVDVDDEPDTALSAARPAGVVVLDNVEQVDGIGLLVDGVLDSAPGLSLLVTSRRPTGVRAEHLVPVPALDRSAAEDLFRARAAQVGRGGLANHREQIRQLCALLDGIPLAVELAAGQVRAVTPKQLLARFESHRTSVLDGADRRVVPNRQASLRRVLQDSYDTLDDQPQRLVQLLGSLEGWVSTEFVEFAAEGWLDDVLDALGPVVDVGLVTTDDAGRVRMLGPVREFAAGLGPRAQLDERVVSTALSVAASAAPRLFGAGAAAALDEIRADADVLSGCLERLLEAGDGERAGQLVLDLNRFWLMSGRLVDGRRLIGRASHAPGAGAATATRLAILAGTYASYVNDPLAVPTLQAALAAAETLDLPIDRLLVNGWCCLAAYAGQHGDISAADAAVARAGMLADASGDRTLISLARDIAGFVAAHSGDHQRSFDHALASLDEARLGSHYDLAHILVTISEDLLRLDRADEALVFAEEAFDIAATIDVGPLLGHILLARGSALVASRQSAAARGCLLEALRHITERGADPVATANILVTLAAAFGQEHRDEQACRSAGAAKTLFRGQSGTGGHVDDPEIRAALDAVRARLGEQRFESLATLGGLDPQRTIEGLLASST
jgi:predicted ATPase/DNA-binding SARP family transcriptional activator